MAATPSIPPPVAATVDQMIPAADDGWVPYYEQAIAAIPSNRVNSVIVDTTDHQFISVAGFDLFNSVSADSLVQAAAAGARSAGKALYFIKIWHNLFGILGTGLDVYRVLLITDR